MKKKCRRCFFKLHFEPNKLLFQNGKKRSHRSRRLKVMNHLFLKKIDLAWKAPSLFQSPNRRGSELLPMTIESNESSISKNGAKRHPET